MKIKNYSPKLVVLALSLILAAGIFLFAEGTGCDVMAAPSTACGWERYCSNVYNCWRETQCQNIYRCEDQYSCWTEYSCQRWYSCHNERVCGWESDYVCSGWGWWRSCGTEWSYSCSNQRVCGWDQWCGPERVCGWSRSCGWEQSCAPRNVCGWQESCENIWQCDPDPEIDPTPMIVIGYTPYPGNSGSTAEPTAQPTSEPDNDDDDQGGNNAPQPTSPPPAATSLPPTATPVPPTSSPVPALNADLDADYSSLVFYASRVGEPPQGMSGEVSGGNGGAYTVILHVRNPEGSESTYNLTTNGTFDFDSGDAGDPDFGTTDEGTWTAWIEASDSVGTTAISASVTWEVGWYPSHETP